MAKKTFNFEQNPADQFISGLPLPNTSNPATTQSGSKPPKAGTNKKDKRICMIIQSALYEDIAKIASVKRISKNEALCRAIRKYRDNERGDLEKYKAFFEDQTD